MSSLAQNTHEAVQYIAKNLTPEANIGLVLGSGLGSVGSALSPDAELLYQEIPFFPVSGVRGHEGRLLRCSIGGQTILVLQGRFHYYEGYTMRGVTFPIKILARLGVEWLILTNAAGGLNKRFRPGDFMLVEDHINLMGGNPLIGMVDEQSRSSRFVDLKGAYDSGLREIATDIAAGSSMKVHSGVLAAVSGPSYETPAEARFLHQAGADAVTMSTVPETIVARQMGMKVLGISCITNSLWDEKQASHTNVVKTGKAAADALAEWVRRIIDRIAADGKGEVDGV